MENEKQQVGKRAALWAAALREGPGETPGPAGRALLAALRKLWLEREAEQLRAMYEPPCPTPDTLAVRPLDSLWAWWPEWRGGDDGPDDVSIGHWRGLHDAAVHAQTGLLGGPDARNRHPAAVQMAATLLPALFHATALGDEHAFALALETLDAFGPLLGPAPDDGTASIAWCGSAAPGRSVFRFPSPGGEPEFDDPFRDATGALLRLGLRAGLGAAARQTERRLRHASAADAASLGFRRRGKKWVASEPEPW